MTAAFDYEDVYQFLLARRGEQFRADTLARHFDIGESAMRQTLATMANREQIRRTSDGAKHYFYIPTQDQINRELGTTKRMFKPLVVDPVITRRVEESRARFRQFPSKR